MRPFGKNTEKPAARVVAFRRPGRPDTGLPPAESPRAVTGLEHYERSNGAEDDYRQRMTINVAALAICVVLSAAGVWVAVNIADLRRNQDCVLSGRKNCAELSVPSGPDRAVLEQAAPKPLPPN